MKRKGQAEIIGLMVIVLLLLFGLLLYFRFAAKESPAFVQEAEQNLEVSNLLTAIQLVTVCDGVSMGDVITACINEEFACGENACTIVERDIVVIIAQTGWGEEEYMFSIGEELYSPSTCTGNTIADSYTTAGTTVQLVFCYR